MFIVAMAGMLGQWQILSSQLRFLSATRCANWNRTKLLLRSSIRVVPLTIRITCSDFTSDGPIVFVGSQVTSGAKTGFPTSAEAEPAVPAVPDAA